MEPVGVIGEGQDKLMVFGRECFFKELDELKRHFQMHLFDFENLDEENFHGLLEYSGRLDIKKVFGISQIDQMYHFTMNKALGFEIYSQRALLHGFNKHLSRKAEVNPFWFTDIDPADDDDVSVSKIKEWPFIFKNTSLCSGISHYLVKTPEQFKAILAEYRRNEKLLVQMERIHTLITDGMKEEELPLLPPFIAEHFIPDLTKTIEFTYEGYVTEDGRLIDYGIAEEAYFKNQEIFMYFMPPISFPKDRASELSDWVKGFIDNLYKEGFKNQFFNIEFWLMEDGSFVMTEFNPRCAWPYQPNYRSTFGVSLLEDAVNLTIRKQEPKRLPWNDWLEDRIVKPSAAVVIATSETGRVGDLFDYEYCRSLEKKLPCVWFERGENEILTTADQTKAGTQVITLWIEANSLRELFDQEADIRSKLTLKAKTNEYPEFILNYQDPLE